MKLDNFWLNVLDIFISSMSSQKFLIYIWLSKSIFCQESSKSFKKINLFHNFIFWSTLLSQKMPTLRQNTIIFLFRVCWFLCQKYRYRILHPCIGNLVTLITIFSDLLNASSKISFCMVLPLISGKLRANSSKLGTPDLITNVKSEMGISPELQKKKNNLNKVINDTLFGEMVIVHRKKEKYLQYYRTSLV